MNQPAIYGVAGTGTVPVRKEPSDSSEMVTQLLLGETVVIKKSHNVWRHVRADFDGYSGWVSAGQIREITPEEYHQWIFHPNRTRIPNRTRLAKGPSDRFLQVPPGAFIPSNDQKVEWFGQDYVFQSDPLSLKGDSILETAKQFLGISYLWGGRTDTGLDCSGFVQTVHMLHGIDLPRDSRDQYESGELRGKELDRAEKGDVIFFRYKDRPVSHIGFYLGEGLLLHASSLVRINQIDITKKNSSEFPYHAALAEGIVGILRPFKP